MWGRQPLAAQDDNTSHSVNVGDTWLALAYRYGVAVADLQAANSQLNRQRQPVIGATITIPHLSGERMGVLSRPYGNVLATAVSQNQSPWQLALQNGLESPYRPLLYAPLFAPGGAAPPQEWPVGLTGLELSQTVPQPGQALGIRGIAATAESVTAALGGVAMDSFVADGRWANNRWLALTGTGAFYGRRQPELTIQVGQGPLWSQPWQFEDPNLWEYQSLTLTGAAAAIDQESIQEERERLFAIWEQNSPQPQWDAPFQLPIRDYLEITSTFGARRSYNGGPFRTYHEGVDFSAYGGTAVFAPAAGTVVVAEPLYVRGGSVILDHGLGIYSGYYHMSDVLVTVGEVVQPGQTIGAVGTTGLSTGNHLHWDLLVNGVWVDAQAWVAQDMACWILAGWHDPCD
ncbi:MAG TPA: LysM peptidoglycan-binding domain-containing M23 family metallopeptidase [Chloroflexota bacterium]|nr:LysM peptidoglycan-binding domain-containing M23 family metallopeptidase [Chloroflexota bacterium]